MNLYINLLILSWKISMLDIVYIFDTRIILRYVFFDVSHTPQKYYTIIFTLYVQSINIDCNIKYYMNYLI